MSPTDRTRSRVEAIDGGVLFGSWPDATSRFIYHDCMGPLLAEVMPIQVVVDGRSTWSIADYGGANGLIQEWFPNALVIDTDASKCPDLVDDVVTHDGRYDLVVMRYLLHYLSGRQVVDMLRRVKSNGTSRILVIQFVNDDFAGKLANSVNETKHFRDEVELYALLKLGGWIARGRHRMEYRVEPDFYRNRLAHPNPTAHDEAVVAYLLEPAR